MSVFSFGTAGFPLDALGKAYGMLVHEISAFLSTPQFAFAMRTALDIHGRGLPEHTMRIAMAAVATLEKADFKPTGFDEKMLASVGRIARLFSDPVRFGESGEKLTAQEADIAALTVITRLRIWGESEEVPNRLRPDSEETRRLDLFRAVLESAEESRFAPECLRALRTMHAAMHYEPESFWSERPCVEVFIHEGWDVSDASNAMIVRQELAHLARYRGWFVSFSEDMMETALDKSRWEFAWRQVENGYVMRLSDYLYEETRFMKEMALIAAHWPSVRVKKCEKADPGEGRLWVRKSFGPEECEKMMTRASMAKCEDLDPIPYYLRITRD